MTNRVLWVRYLQRNCRIKRVAAVCDDIVDYLVSKGVELSSAYEIMEKTRYKEKTELTQELFQTMRGHGIAEWYIKSLKKFRFLFPKFVIAKYAEYFVGLIWYKLYYPQECYEYDFELLSLLKTANEAICRGVDLTGIV